MLGPKTYPRNLQANSLREEIEKLCDSALYQKEHQQGSPPMPSRIRLILGEKVFLDDDYISPLQKNVLVQCVRQPYGYTDEERQKYEASEKFQGALTWSWVNRRYKCRCREHTPSRWYLCALCHEWVGAGCYPVKCWAERHREGLHLCSRCSPRVPVAHPLRDLYLDAVDRWL